MSANELAIQDEANLIKGVLGQRTDLDLPNHVSALDPDAFLFPPNRVIWGAIQAVVSGGGLIDSWVLRKAMAKLGAHEHDFHTLDEYFHASEYASFSDLRPRVAAVAEAYKRRMISHSCQGMVESCLSDDLKTVETNFEDLSARVAAAGTSKLRAGTDYARQFEAFLSGAPILPPESRENLVRFGIPGIDQTIMANPGRLIVLGGLPSAGKTALALQAVVRTATAGKRTAMGSLEMDDDEIAARIVACGCGVNSLHALRGTPRPGREDRAILEAVRRNLVGLHGCAGDSWTAIEASIVREHRRSPLSLAVVDYLQLLEAPETRGRRQESEASRIGEITKSAKRLAQRLKINVLMLSQFNREVEEAKEPTLQNFLGSGQIERDVDIALLMWNDKAKFEPTGDRIVNCRIAKNRGGERWGKVRMKFNPALNRFEQDYQETDSRQTSSRFPELGE